MFYGRETQKKSLLKMINSDEQRVSLIYGRRRIGKSELIKQVIKESDCKSIYYECKQTTEQNNVDSLSEIVGETFGIPKPHFYDFEKLIRYVAEEAKKENIFVIICHYFIINIFSEIYLS